MHARVCFFERGFSVFFPGFTCLNRAHLSVLSVESPLVQFYIFLRDSLLADLLPDPTLPNRPPSHSWSHAHLHFNSLFETTVKDRQQRPPQFTYFLLMSGMSSALYLLSVSVNTRHCLTRLHSEVHSEMHAVVLAL